MIISRPLLSYLTLFVFPMPALAFTDCISRPGSDGAYVARIVTAPKLNFIGADGKKSRSYVVEGDEVLTFKNELDQTCVLYLSEKNAKMSYGLVDEAMLRVIQTRDLPLKAIFGHWTDGLAEVKIGPGLTADKVTVLGSAVFNQYHSETDDTAEYTGEIIGSDGLPLEVQRTGNKFGFTQGDADSIGNKIIGDYRSVSSLKPDDGCAAKFELLSNRYLYVEDNQRCGGLNVSFTGLYIKKN
jgi:hypothetical protein